MINRKISIAPMMNWTDTHCRYFFRLLSPTVLLYTEMITTGALLHNDAKRFLAYDESEHPLALQLGGSNPHDLALCAKLAEEAGYDEVNLNVGCPSDRVQQGKFGACLMKEPRLVADCVRAMKDAVSIPVTVKTRIGVDELDTYSFLVDFIHTISDAGCEVFIMHARKAWLTGLSPKQNRTVPPLQYDRVRQLQQDFPQSRFILNGGIDSLSAITEHLSVFSGVMLGRAAYHDSYLLAQCEEAIFNGHKKSREDILAAMQEYIDRQRLRGVPEKSITRHLLGLYKNEPHSKAFRRALSS